MLTRVLNGTLLHEAGGTWALSVANVQGRAATAAGAAAISLYCLWDPLWDTFQEHFPSAQLGGDNERVACSLLAVIACWVRLTRG